MSTHRQRPEIACHLPAFLCGVLAALRRVAVDATQPKMPRVSQLLERFVALVEQGRSVEAMERYYAEDVVVFENRALARAGRQRCIAFEREQHSRAPQPATLKALKHACNEATGVSFVEWLIRFETEAGRAMRLEEVAVQSWRDGAIVEERFYYEGVIDEGD